MKNLPILLLLIFALSSCNNDLKSNQDLEQREEALLLREAKFADKEADYNSLLKMRDSLMAAGDKIKDTIVPVRAWPDSLGIKWNSKMVCRESKCSNYVIGDQRNEVWQFVSDSTGIYANVLNKNKVVRVFKADYLKGKIGLNFTTDSTATKKVIIDVVLDDIKDDVIKGIQTITGQDNCTAKFSVELTPSKK